MGLCHDGEVRPLFCRVQEGFCCTPPGTPFLVHLKIGIAKIVAAVEFRNFGNATILCRITPGVQDLPVDPAFLDAQFTASAVVLICAVLVVFGSPEHWQDIVPRPAAVAELRPVIIIAVLSAHVDHRVNG